MRPIPLSLKRAFRVIKDTITHLTNSKTNFTETKSILIFKDDGDDIIIKIATSKDEIEKKARSKINKNI